MKLCVANLARTDMTPRPERVAAAPCVSFAAPPGPVSFAAPAGPTAARRKLESMFESDEEDAPTTLYAAPRKSSPRLSADHRKLSAAMAAVLAG